MEKKMENEMETGIIRGLGKLEWVVQRRVSFFHESMTSAVSLCLYS